jgi:hypothetical protein
MKVWIPGVAHKTFSYARDVRKSASSPRTISPQSVCFAWYSANTVCDQHG